LKASADRLTAMKKNVTELQKRFNDQMETILVQVGIFKVAVGKAPEKEYRTTISGKSRLPVPSSSSSSLSSSSLSSSSSSSSSFSTPVESSYATIPRQGAAGPAAIERLPIAQQRPDGSPLGLGCLTSSCLRRQR
jgi:hypothetical protein